MSPKAVFSESEDVGLDFWEVTGRAFRLLPGSGMEPALRMGDKPAKGDGGAWLERELRTGYPAGTKDGIPTARFVGRAQDSRDMHYGASPVPRWPFRGPLTPIQVRLDNKKIKGLLIPQQESWEVVEWNIKWRPLDLATIIRQTVWHLDQTLAQIEEEAPGA